jgi:hypothetical protein
MRHSTPNPARPDNAVSGPDARTRDPAGDQRSVAAQRGIGQGEALKALLAGKRPSLDFVSPPQPG